MSQRASTWMPLYIGDYLRDTQHLTRDQHGAYLLLLMACWSRGGHLPADDQQLAAIVKATPAEWRRLKPVIAPFFTEDDSGITQKRLSFELAKARRNAETRAENGKKGGRPKANEKLPVSESEPDGKAKAKQNETPSPSPSPSESSEAIASGAAAPTDIRSMVFGGVLSWWREVTGDDDKPARAFLAKQCRDFDNATVVLAAGNLQSRAPPLYEPRSALIAECQRIWGERDAKRASHNGAGQPGGHGTMFAGFAEAAARAKTG